MERPGALAALALVFVLLSTLPAPSTAALFGFGRTAASDGAASATATATATAAHGQRLGVQRRLGAKVETISAAATSAESASASTSGAGVGLGAPQAQVLGMYRKFATQYEKEAEGAEVEAARWAQKTREVEGEGNSLAAKMTHDALIRLGVPTWAHAAWEVQRMLNDPRPKAAAIAVGKATAPYKKAYADYAAAQGAYDGAAQGYALRAKADAFQAKQLQTYANQYRLEGDKVNAGTFGGQADLLMKQAENMKGMAQTYTAFAGKINKVLPVLQQMTGQAATFAAWKENPTGVMPAEHVFPFTVVPPLEN